MHDQHADIERERAERDAHEHERGGEHRVLRPGARDVLGPGPDDVGRELEAADGAGEERRQGVVDDP